MLDLVTAFRFYTRDDGLGAMISVLIACDIRLYREGLSLHLARQDRLGVVGSASTTDETFRMARELAPDVLLLDMAMRDSLAIVHELRSTVPDTQVLALAIPEADGAVIACAEAGVAGFVMREASLADLVDAILSAARGEACMSPRAAAALLRRVGTLAADRVPSAAHAELTVREREIVELIDHGMSNKAIAARLHVELATVKNHVHNILDKLQVHRRGEIAARLRHAPAAAAFRFEPDAARRELRS
ncbi:MAG: regulatory protein LuxR [Gemmatimonadetes bacterium]|nr:regulatory protein LuxR [Gemmatimonadota bacterium]